MELEQKPQSKKKRIIGIVIGAAVAALILVLCFIFPKGAPSSQFYVQKQQTLVMGHGENAFEIITKDGRTGVEGQYYQLVSTPSGSHSLILEGSGEFEPDSSGQMFMILFDVYSMTGECLMEDVLYLQLAENGERFLANVLDEQEQSQLVLYEDGNVTEIGKVSNMIASPDCASILYVGEGELIEGKNEHHLTTPLYFYQNGKSTLIHEDATPIGLANGGERIFYVTDQTHLHVRFGANGRDKKLSLESRPDKIHVSADGMEVIFRDFYANVYLYHKGDQFVQLASDPENPEDVRFFTPAGTKKGQGRGDLPIRRLGGTFYNHGTDLYRLEHDYSSKLIVKDYAEAAISQNGQAVYYVINEKLYLRDFDRSATRSTLLVEGGISLLIGATDGGIFYEGDDGAVHFVNKMGDISLIESARYAFYDGKLYYSDPEHETLLCTDGEKTLDTWNFSAMLYHVTNENGLLVVSGVMEDADGGKQDVYFVSFDGKTFETVADGYSV